MSKQASKKKSAPTATTTPRPMNKAQFIEAMAEHTYEKNGEREHTFESKAAAKRAVEAFLATMQGAVDAETGGNGVVLTGYFSLKRKVRPARQNAKVFGETRDIPETVVPRMTAGIRLRKACRGEA